MRALCIYRICNVSSKERVFLGNLCETSGVFGNLQSCFKDEMKRSVRLWEKVAQIYIPRKTLEKNAQHYLNRE